MTTTETTSTAILAQKRLQEELVAVATAHPDFNKDAARNGIAIALYAAYIRRQEEAHARDDIIKRMVLFNQEEA